MRTTAFVSLCLLTGAVRDIATKYTGTAKIELSGLQVVLLLLGLFFCFVQDVKEMLK